MQISVENQEYIGGGVQGAQQAEALSEPLGNTRMISSIIKEVKAQKQAILLNQQLQQDMDTNLVNNNPDLFLASQANMPDLSEQANHIDKFLPELVELK